MEDTLFRGNSEPTLDQILAEPIVQSMMRRDRIDERTIRALMRTAVGAKAPRFPKLDFVAPAPPPAGETSGLPEASLGVLAQAAAEPRWPRVFPSL
jgi:hypothetical protein